MTVLRLCELGNVRRAGVYRFALEDETADRDLNLRDQIQRITLEFPCYGRPRITYELRRRGWQVNHKRVHRIMREDNLLCLRKRKFVVTTDSNHNLRVCPNLAGDMQLTDLDQLWIADITYIRLECEFVYLAVVLDAYSRRVIGRALDRNLEDDLAIAALKMAFRRRSPAERLTHHSDRGVQYASNDYTGLLKEHGVRISMSRSGKPYDNATKRIVHEDAEVRRSLPAGLPRPRDLADARASIRALRRESLQRQATALGSGLPPADRVRTLIAESCCFWFYSTASAAGQRMKNKGALGMRFLRHDGIYRSNVSSHLVTLGRRSRFTVEPVPGYRTRRKEHAPHHPR